MIDKIKMKIKQENMVKHDVLMDGFNLEQVFTMSGLQLAKLATVSSYINSLNDVKELSMWFYCGEIVLAYQHKGFAEFYSIFNDGSFKVNSFEL